VSTLGQMVEQIRGDLDRGTDFDSRIKLAIERAIRYYKGSRLGFNLKRAFATLTSGNEYVSLPLDWVEADLLRLDRGNEREVMEEVTYDWMEDVNQAADQRGRPYKYAIQHRTLRLYPTPDQTYTLMLSFQYELTDVSASADDSATNAWLSEAEELIRKHAMSELYVLYIDGPDAVQKGRYLRRECEEEILPKLEALAAREQSSGRLKPYL
jgi:hypothetical protein